MNFRGRGRPDRPVQCTFVNRADEPTFQGMLKLWVLHQPRTLFILAIPHSLFRCSHRKPRPAAARPSRKAAASRPRSCLRTVSRGYQCLSGFPKFRPTFPMTHQRRDDEENPRMLLGRLQRPRCRKDKTRLSSASTWAWHIADWQTLSRKWRLATGEIRHGSWLGLGHRP